MVLPHSSSTVAQGNNGLGVLQAWPDGDSDEAKEHRRQLLLGQLWVTKEALAKACGASCLMERGGPARRVYGVQAANVAVANGLRAAAVLAPLPQTGVDNRAINWQQAMGSLVQRTLFPAFSKITGNGKGGVGASSKALGYLRNFPQMEADLKAQLVLPADLAKIAFVRAFKKTGRKRTGLGLPQREG